MSAFGQKQTLQGGRVMSALPPKADMCSALGYVRFGPIADIQHIREHEMADALLVGRRILRRENGRELYAASGLRRRVILGTEVQINFCRQR
jgi:hypothetical protein